MSVAVAWPIEPPNWGKPSKQLY